MPSPPSKSRLLRILGPGLITGASDDDPSGIATYSQAGAQLGFAVTWTMLFSYPLMAVIQEISARIGRTTGRGIAGNIRQHYPNWLLQAIVVLTDIESSSQAAEAPRPVAGPFAFALFTLGIVGTGLLAVPVLAGSAAYALGEARKWPIGLARKPKKAKAFYLAIATATFIGILINVSPINPIKALYWSAVINGIVAVPVMAIMMLMAVNAKVMGEFTIPLSMRVIGWGATLVMALAVIGMVVATWV